MKKVKLSEAPLLTSFERANNEFLMLDGNQVKKINTSTIEAEESRTQLQRFRINSLGIGQEVETGMISGGLYIAFNVTRGRTGLFTLHSFTTKSLQTMIASGQDTISIDPDNTEGKVLIYRKENNGVIFIKNNDTQANSIILIRLVLS